MRILVPVDGSAAANRAAVHALSLAGYAKRAEIVLVNMQSRRTIEVCDILP